MVALFKLFPVCLQPGRPNYSDSLAAHISTALVKRVKRHDYLIFDIGYFIDVHVGGLIGGSDDVYIDVTFP